jgi:hypothetical protein
VTLFKIKGASQATASYVDLSYRQAELWPAQVLGMANTVLLIGDDQCGPAMALTALEPGTMSELGTAHCHGADNFRTPIRGSVMMGPETYKPGDFRFQDGWRIYPSDNNACGPEGGWGFIVMADRRGFRRRNTGGWKHGSGDPAEEIALQHYISKMFEFEGDLVDADESVSPGPSAMATTLGHKTSGKLVGSFSDQESWRPVSAATRVAVALMGDPTCGPVLVLADTDPHRVAMAGSTFDTEVLHVVVSGSCSIDGRIYETGDLRLQIPGKPCGPICAGPDGLRELVVFGDRRHATPVAISGREWPSGIDAIVAELMADLSARGIAPERVNH